MSETTPADDKMNYQSSSGEDDDLPSSKKPRVEYIKHFKGKVQSEDISYTWQVPNFNFLSLECCAKLFDTKGHKWKLHQVLHDIKCNCKMHESSLYFYIEPLNTITRNTFVTVTFEIFPLSETPSDEKETFIFHVVFRPSEVGPKFLGMLRENIVNNLRDKTCFKISIKLNTTYATYEDRPNENTYKDLEFIMSVISDPNAQPDVTIFVGDKEVRKVHSKRLCEMSEVFSRMFENDTLERRSRNIVITDFSEDAVQHMVFFMYNSVVQTTDTECLTELIRIADKYDLGKLKETCEAILICKMDEFNVIKILNEVDIIGSQTILKDLSIIFVESFVSNIFQHSRSDISTLNPTLFHQIWKKCASKHNYLDQEINSQRSEARIHIDLLNCFLNLLKDNSRNKCPDEKYYGNIKNDEITFDFNREGCTQMDSNCKEKQTNYCTFKLHLLSSFNFCPCKVCILDHRGTYLEIIDSEKMFCSGKMGFISIFYDDIEIGVFPVFCGNKGINLSNILNAGTSPASLSHPPSQNCCIKIILTYADVKPVTKQNWCGSEPWNKYMSHSFENRAYKEDVIITVGETTIKACSKILSNYPTFTNMINSAKYENTFYHIEIPNFSENVVRGMIDFVENFVVYNVELNFLIELLEIAKAYCLEDLEGTCEAIILNAINEHNIIEILNKISTFGIKSNLMKSAIDFAVHIAIHIFNAEENFILDRELFETIWGKLALEQNLLKLRTTLSQRPNMQLSSFFQQRGLSQYGDQNCEQIIHSNQQSQINLQPAPANPQPLVLQAQSISIPAEPRHPQLVNHIIQGPFIPVQGVLGNRQQANQNGELVHGNPVQAQMVLPIGQPAQNGPLPAAPGNSMQINPQQVRMYLTDGQPVDFNLVPVVPGISVQINPASAVLGGSIPINPAPVAPRNHQ